MATLKVDTITSDTLPTVAITDGLVVSGVSTFHDVVNIETDDNNAFNIIDNSASFRPSINFKKNDSGTVSTLMQIRAEGTNGLDIKDGSGNLRLRVDSSGEIISYNGTLRRNVSDSSFTFTGDTASNTGSNISVYGASHSTLASVVRFRSGATETVRIDSSGRVLIGTTVEGSSGADELTINTASGHGGMTIRNDTSSNGNIWFSDGTSGAAEYAGYVQYAHNGDHMVFGTNGSEKLRIASDGNVGINETSPDAPIHITGGLPSILLENSGTSASAGDILGKIEFKHNDSDDAGVTAAIKCIAEDTAGNSYLTFNNGDGGNADERLRITSDGTCKFDPSAGGTLSITGSSAHTSKIIIGDNANTGAGNCLVEGADGGDYFTIQSNGNVNFASGNGVTFADSATSAILNDYEEGDLNWRLIKKDASNAGSNNSDTVMKYTKVGDTVYISGYIRTDGTQGSEEGNLKIVDISNTSNAGSLPFTPNHNGVIFVGHTRTVDELTESICIAFNKDNTGVAVFTNDGTGQYTPYVNNVSTNTQTNLVITFEGVYHTNQ